MIFFPNLKFKARSIKIIAIIGFLAGLIFAIYEITFFLLRTKTQFLLLLDFFYNILFLMIIYGLVGALGMILFGGAILLLMEMGEYRLDKNRLITLQAGLAALLIASFILADAFDVFSINDLSRLVMVTAYILLFSFLAAIGIGALTYFLITCYSFKKLFFWGRIILLTLFIVWSLWITLSRSLYAPKDISLDPLLSIEGESSNIGPNILWIVMDTTRADHLSSYGYYRNTTPYIDSIAKEGVLYKNAFSEAPWTTPSHASMFTGLFPSGHGVDQAWNWLGDNFTTIAEVLHEQGYYTAAFSNNVYVSKSNNLAQGFDSFILVERVDAENWHMELSLLPRMVLKLKDTLNVQSTALTFFYNLITPKFHCTAVNAGNDTGAEYTNKLVKTYVERLKTKRKPFFIFINYMEVHALYGDSPGAGKYLDELNVELSETEAYRSPDEYKYLAGEAKLNDKDIEILNALYDGDLAYLDQKIGELLEYFRDLEILDDTVVIITSDHGENLGQHSAVCHINDIHRSLTYVPLIIRYPKLFLPGTVEERAVQTIDLYPTILEILGAGPDSNSNIQGYSLFDVSRPQLTVSEARFEPNLDKEGSVLERFPDYKLRLGGGMFKSIRAGEYEYIIEGSLEEYLYNIKEDPQELYDLSDSEQEKAKEMENLLIQWSQNIKHYWEPF
jgi:arylsulfatase A-like enzyme